MKISLQQFGFSSLSLRERFLVVGGYLIVILVLLTMVYLPKQREAARLEERLKTLKLEIQTLSMALQELQRRAQTVSQNPPEQGQPATLKIAQGEERISNILGELAGMAKREGIELISVRPEVLGETEGFLRLSLQIDIRSRFIAFLRYLERLEGLSSPIAISDIRMETNKETSPMVSSGLKAEVQVRRGM
jgi:hypothetical protein